MKAKIARFLKELKVRFLICKLALTKDAYLFQYYDDETRSIYSHFCTADDMNTSVRNFYLMNFSCTSLKMYCSENPDVSIYKILDTVKRHICKRKKQAITK